MKGSSITTILFCHFFLDAAALRFKLLPPFLKKVFGPTDKKLFFFAFKSCIRACMHDQPFDEIA